MAKIVLYAGAKTGQQQALLAAASNLFEHSLMVSQGVQLTLMTVMDNDPLSVPSDSAFITNMDAALELALPCGQPLLPLLPELKKALEPLLACMDLEHSHVLQGYHRVFKETGPKPLRYHYLMHRRADFGHADYLDYYVHHHYQFGVKTPLIDYFQTYINHDSSRDLAELLGVQAITAENISEMHLDSMDAFLSTDVMAEIGPAAAEDEEKFVDRANSTSFTLEVVRTTDMLS